MSFSSDSFDHVLEFSKNAFEGMAKHSVPPTPENFQVWYTHMAGRNPNLSHMMSILVDNNQEFTAAISQDLYDRFFTTQIGDDVLHETTDRINEELGRILEYVGEASDGATNYGTTLKSAEGALISETDAGGLKAVIDNVLTETRKMEEINQKLEQKLVDSTSEVSQLRGDLEDMRKEALTDALTGIANRKLFDMELRRAARDAMENGDTLSLLMIDIDHFKKFNDTYGHQVGDEVLKLISNTLKKSVKGGDLPARYGGEEFAVVLPKTDIKGAISVAQSIRGRISTRKLVNRQTNTNLGKITVSIGVAQFEYGEKLTHLIHRADQALYTAKHKGRDKVVDQSEVEEGTLAFDS